jgi:hypothetical protein
MGRHPYRNRKSQIVADENISTLTKQQLSDIVAAAATHRPLHLLSIFHSSRTIRVQAYDIECRERYGEWILSILDSGDVVLQVEAGGVLWMENIITHMPAIWPRVMDGLRDWGKLVNTVEAGSASGAHPAINHLYPANLMDVASYSPLGEK